MRNWQKILWLVLIAVGCKEPFIPNLPTSNNIRYLVIEGSISMNDSTLIRLTRTKKVDTLRKIYPETGAAVTIETDANASYQLAEIRTGMYAAPPLDLDASRKYRLRIKTVDNKEYVSDFVAVKNAPPIDSVGFAAQPSGVRVYVNAHDAANTTRFYRWEFTEDWQFHSKYLSTYYNGGDPRAVEDQIYYCFSNDSSTNIVLASTTKLASDIVYQAPVTVIPANSEKIEKKYSILVKQYALTPDAYAFWLNLQKNTEKLGSIFDVQPSETQSNFRCVSNPTETVVGFLSAGNASYKRIFITADQLLPTYSPKYPGDCDLDTAFLNPKTPQQVISTNIFNQNNSLYLAVSGLYLPPPNPFGKPTALTYSTLLCVDCTLRGTKVPPPFWR
jgi:hypothetical protein